MACRFLDSFDGYATAQLAAKYTSTVGAPTILAAGGRNGTQSLHCAGQYVAKTLDSQATWVVGFSLKATALGADTLLGWWDGATAQVDFRITNTGTLQLTRAGTVLGTSVATIAVGATHFIEVLFTIHPSAGVAQIHLDGVSVLNLTGQNTRNTANSTADNFRLGDQNGPGPLDFDDLYVFDGTGATNNTFAGDQRVQALVPNGAGTYSAWTATGAATGWQATSEIPPDGDTSYVADSTPGDKESFTVASLAAGTLTVTAVQTNMYAKKSDASAHTIAPLIRNHSTDSQGATVALSTAYLYYLQQYDTNPSNANAAWAVADVNSGEFGATEVS